MKGICELCHRENLELTIHHLTPKEEGGTRLPTANLCKGCHKHIHALYTNQELAFRLSTISLLQDDEQIKKYIKWIQKQPSSRFITSKKSNDKKRKQGKK